MHIGQTIRHHKDWRSISFLLSILAFCRGDFILGRVLGSTARSQITRIVPKLDLSEKSFRVRSFMCPGVALLVTIILSDDRVASGRQHKEIRDHADGSLEAKVTLENQ